MANMDNVADKPCSKGHFQDILLAAHSLVLFRSLLDDHVIQGFLGLLEAIDRFGLDYKPVIEAYYSFVNRLATRAVSGSWPDAWQRHLVRLILESENTFSRMAEAGDPEKLPGDLYKLAAHDLQCLEKMFAVDPHEVKALVKHAYQTGETEIPGWEHLVLTPGPEPEAAFAFYESKGWSSLVSLLARHYHSCGSGKFARFTAFHWYRGELQEIQDPDPITLDMLIGLDEQKKIIAENTEYFLQGLPACNILLYGKRGTGKSSLVKAVLNQYQSQGLRLVEVSKEALSELPQVLRLLRGRVFRFIVFIDDLSFEEYEVEYKFLKGILEGGIETLPDNVLVYATSNRRHLVSEYFSDRKETEIHQDDSLQEKLSIADRFGISILFPSPSQELYLRIVEGLVRQRGLDIESQELRSLALKWEKSHNGPSGRTARQFVDYITARTARKK